MKSLYPFITCVVLSVFLGSSVSYAQITRADYRKGDSLRKFYDLVYHSDVDPSWVHDTHNLWYKVNTEKGEVYFIVDADRRTKERAFDQEKLCEELNDATGGALLSYSLPLEYLSFNEDLDAIEFR